MRKYVSLRVVRRRNTPRVIIVFPCIACWMDAKESLEIHCQCTFVWCWACGEEAHMPASCKTVNQWNVKNSAESENISWIRAHTKKCPKCSALSRVANTARVAGTIYISCVCFGPLDNPGFLFCMRSQANRKEPGLQPHGLLKGMVGFAQRAVCLA